jgi:hypothetical protein
MGPTLRRVTTSLLTLGVLASFASPAGASNAATRTDTDRVRSAIGYLATQQKANGSIPAFSPLGSTSDAVLAIVAAGTGKPQLRAALGYLHRQVTNGKANTIGLQAKVVSALAAAGRDPRSFAGTNLVKAIRATLGADGRFGDAAVFDDALATIALEAAGVKVPSRATRWLLDAQCPDGGWQYDEPASTGEDGHCQSTTDPSNDFFQSDTNTTSYVVQAIEAHGGGTFTHDPFAFFTTIRDGVHGGWGYSWGVETTDANSTALAIQAYAAAAVTLPDGAMDALRALQDPTCGGWAFTWVDDPSGSHPDDPNAGATIGAVLGILQQALPVPSGVVHGHVPADPTCA